MPHPIDLGLGFNSLPVLQNNRIVSQGGGGGGGFSGNVIHIDGVNDFATFVGALATSVGSSKEWIINLWMNPYYAVSSLNQLYRQSRGTTQHYFYLSTALVPSWDKVNGAQAMELVSNTNSYLPGIGSGWTHMLAACDGNSVWCLMNSIHLGFQSYVYNNTAVHWASSGNHWLFTDADSQAGPQMDFTEYYLNFGEGLDLSQQANVELFRTPGGAPADLGTNGASVTGNTPTLYFTGDAAAWNAGSANVGYTDNQFTVIGAFTDANTSP